MRMFAVIRGLGIVSRVRVIPLPGRRNFRPSRPANSDSDWVWPLEWGEPPLPTEVIEKNIRWTPVLLITKYITFHPEWQRVETKVNWTRTECDG